MQQSFDEYTNKGKEFNFITFLQKYSEIVYEPFVFMLYQEQNGLTEFNRDKFRSLISLQYKQGDEIDNGKQFLERLAFRLKSAFDNIQDKSNFNLAEESENLVLKGVLKENIYLYVRGHNLYNSLISIGKKLCEGTGADFEQNILKKSLVFEQYDAISRIKTDIGILKTIRNSLNY